MSSLEKKPQPSKSTKTERAANVGQKAELTVKKSAKAKAMMNAPDEVIARAIHDALLKEKETPVKGKKKQTD